MKDFIFVFVTFFLVIVDLFVAHIYTEGIRLILQKNRLWIRMFLLWMGILFLQTAVFSWLPGRVGAELTLLDGLIVLEDGALIRNFGYMILAHVIGIGIAILKYLWEVIRGRDRFYGKFFLLEIFIGSVLCFLSIQLIRSEYVMHFEGGEAAGTIVMIILAVTGALGIFLGFRTDRSEKTSEKTSEKNAGESRQSDRSAASQASSKEALARYDRIMAEKNRLAGKGDYASQIPLLIEAVGLDVDVTRKSRCWNYLGAAYKNIGSGDKAAECFRNARRTDPENPSSYINLAFYYADRGQYDTALQNADTAIAKAEQVGISPGRFYAGYALIAGRSGDRKKAEHYLCFAENAGCDRDYIISIRKRVGMNK